MAESYVHFFGGSTLNRLSWVRNSPAFLGLAITHPRAKFVVFNDGQPLVNVTVGPKNRPVSSFAHIPATTVLPLLGPAPYFAQGEKPGDLLPSHLQTTEHNGAGKFLEAARLHGPIVVFLGIEEHEGDPVLSSSEFKDPSDIRGDPYFALDATNIGINLLREIFGIAKPVEGESLPKTRIEFQEPRSATNTFTQLDASIFSVARSMVDWNSRNKFCASCGCRVYSLWAGWKLSCSSLLPWTNNTDRAPCATAKGLHNQMHPRTDAVVITAVIDETGERILLGRNKRFPASFYSTLAGFLEPSESLEDAVAREIYEESGVRVKQVRYHSCQPWPYPANLMIGCFAVADAAQPIRTDLDNELEDAKWFTREEVLHTLASSSGTRLKKKELKRFDNPDSVSSGEESDGGAPPAFRVPGLSAIAGVLISQWAKGEVSFGSVGAVTEAKSNL